MGWATNSKGNRQPSPTKQRPNRLLRSDWTQIRLTDSETSEFQSSTMEREHRRQPRRIKTAAEEEPRSVHDVQDDLLRLILLRLDSPLWLVRAACACRRWRRAMADGGRAFLRLAGSLHPPAVVGHYHVHRCRSIAFVPSPPMPPIDVGRFSLDFLPHAKKDWEVAD